MLPGTLVDWLAIQVACAASRVSRRRTYSRTASMMPSSRSSSARSAFSAAHSSRDHRDGSLGITRTRTLGGLSCLRRRMDSRRSSHVGQHRRPTGHTPYGAFSRCGTGCGVSRASGTRRPTPMAAAVPIIPPRFPPMHTDGMPEPLDSPVGGEPRPVGDGNWVPLVTRPRAGNPQNLRPIHRRSSLAASSMSRSSPAVT